MKKDIIESLRYPAHVTAWIFGQGQGHWQGFNPDGNELKYKVISDSEIRWYWKDDFDGRYITYKDIRPGEISKTTYDDPKIISSDVRDAYSSVASNTSDIVEMERTYSITEGTETSSVNNLGVSVTAGIAQSISYGGELYGAGGETSFSLDIETSFSHEWSEGSSTERTIETSITIPPKTKTTLTATKSRSKLRQKIHYECDIDFSIEFMSWGTALYRVESRDVMKKAFEGEYYDGAWTVDDGDWGAQNHANVVGHGLQNQPRAYDNFLFPHIVTKFTKEIKFDKSVTGEVILKSEEIE